MNFTKLAPLGACLATVASLASLPAWAQPSADEAWGQRRGFALGIRLMSDFISTDDPPPGESTDQVYIEESGRGAQFSLGYTFTPSFHLRLSGGGAVHETTRKGLEATHSSGVLEAHYRFLAGQRIRPYVYGGLGGSTVRMTSDDLDSEISGGVGVLGAGLFYYFTQHLSLDFAVRLDRINWNQIRLTGELPDGTRIRLEDPVDENGSAAKLLFGLDWQF